MLYEFLFLKALLLTVTTELVAAVLIRTCLTKNEFRTTKLITEITWTRFILGISFASTLTLPYVWFIFSLIQPRALFMWTAELFAWLMETLFYKYFFHIDTTRALAFSFLLNLFSVLAGLAIFPLLLNS